MQQSLIYLMKGLVMLTKHVRNKIKWVKDKELILNNQCNKLYQVVPNKSKQWPVNLVALWRVTVTEKIAICRVIPVTKRHLWTKWTMIQSVLKKQNQNQIQGMRRMARCLTCTILIKILNRLYKELTYPILQTRFGKTQPEQCLQRQPASLLLRVIT